MCVCGVCVCARACLRVRVCEVLGRWVSLCVVYVWEGGTPQRPEGRINTTHTRTHTHTHTCVKVGILGDLQQGECAGLNPKLTLN